VPYKDPKKQKAYHKKWNAEFYANNRSATYARVRARRIELRAWLDNEEDEDLLANITVLTRLEEQFRRHGVYDVLDVVGRAKTLSKDCPRLREERLDELNAQVDAAALVWADYSAFWTEYPYQSFFRDFKNLLFAGKRRFVEARSIAGENLSSARERLQTGQAQVKRLTGFVDRMLKVKLVLDAMAIFLQKLVVAELVFSGLAFLSLPLIIAFSGVLGPNILHLVKNPQFQKSCMVMVTMFVAPLFALALTIRSMSER